jgi:hypothetical protein
LESAFTALCLGIFAQLAHTHCQLIYWQQEGARSRFLVLKNRFGTHLFWKPAVSNAAPDIKKYGVLVRVKNKSNLSPAQEAERKSISRDPGPC